jgi:apolipoprotein N-acyltransferase
MALALLPALILGIYVRYPALARLPYLALLPWVVLYTDDRRPRVSVGHYFLGALATWIALYPGCYGYGWIAPVFLGLICVVPWLPFAPILRRVHRSFGLPRVWTVPLIWVAIEWLRAEVTVGHFDLYRLGYSQARFTNLAQISEVVGVYGVSYGALRLRGLEVVDGPRLAVVQPNVLHTIRNLRGVHLTQMLMTDEKVPAGAVDLIVWPENAIMDDIRRGGPYLEDLRWLAAQKDAALLVGALGLPEEHPGRTTNTAYLLTRDGTIAGSYAKTYLFAWSEYVPQDDLLLRLSPAVHRAHRILTRKSWGFLPTGVAGEGMVLLDLPTEDGDIPFSVLICVENSYPPFPAEAGRAGARFLVNITSEGDVGGPVQEQLLRICIFRAVENRVGYVRAGNTGISGFIDPAGRVQSVLLGERGRTTFDSGVLIDRVRVASGEPTLYSRSGDAFAKACVIATLLIWGWSWVADRRRARGALIVLAVLATGCSGAPAPGRDPGIAGPSLERGLRLFEEESHSEALEALTAACGDPSRCREALQPTAVCFLKVGEPEHGADYFAAVAERHPGLAAEALGYRGYMLEKSLEPGAAEDAYRQSLSVTPTEEAYALLAKLLVRNGEMDRAIETFREGLRILPRTTTLRFLYGRALMMHGGLDESRKELQAVLGNDPANAPAWNSLGRVYIAMGEDASAVAAFRRALEVDPADIEARYQLARIAIRNGETGEAHRLLREITEIETTLGRGPREDD